MQPGATRILVLLQLDRPWDLCRLRVDAMKLGVTTFGLMLVCILGAGCQTSDVKEQSVTTPAALSSSALTSFEATWPSRTAQEVAGRSQTVAQILRGRSVGSAQAFADAVAKSAYAGTPEWLSEPESGLMVLYHPKQDDLRVEDLTVSTDVSAGEDVGDAAARATFDLTLDSLGSEGVLDLAHFDRTKVDLAYARAGSAPMGQMAKEYVTAYIFTALRYVNGIPFANAGIRVAVHRSGRVSWIRVGGAQVASRIADGVEVPVGKGGTFARTVADDALLNRFTKERPNAVVEWTRLMYYMPDSSSSAIIEPQLIISHVHRTMSEGVQIVSRRQTLGYSIRDASAPPRDLTSPPAPGSKGDPRP
jgi:hypothetical protein